MHIRWGPGPGRTANVAVRGRADIPPAAPHTETISCGSLKGQVAISEKPTGYTSASKNRNNSRPPWTNSRGPTRVVALIVKMDDLGLKLAERSSPRSQRLGRLLVAAMPKVLNWLSVIGTAAMLWVGGHILLVGFDELGWSAPYYLVHRLEELVHGVPAIGGALAWTVNTAASALVGMVVGALLVVVVERLPFRRARGEHAVHGG